MRINYSCVVENKEFYQKQGWLWLNSLICFGKIDPKSIYVHCIEGTTRNYMEKCAGTGVNVSVIQPFGDKKYCNKIPQMSNEKLRDSDAVIVMDTDMVMLENFEHTIDYNHISGKIIYMKNPETQVIDSLFELAGVKKSLPDMPIESDGAYFTYGANFNGGLYIMPDKYCETIKSGWEKWSVWMLENGKPLYEAKKENHIDQLSFCMTVHENNIPVKYLDHLYNYHILFDLGEKEKKPYVLHYHTQTDENNLITLDYVPEGKVKEAVLEANRFIKKYISML
ncbi:MAG: hypothetical protein FWD23_12870 [Oscillospiraceae bacterium]|nr:hypothetical protein [Oscillospiraceae bacterium]